MENVIFSEAGHVVSPTIALALEAVCRYDAFSDYEYLTIAAI